MEKLKELVKECITENEDMLANGTIAPRRFKAINSVASEAINEIENIENRIAKLENALKDAQKVLEKANRYFPKSIKNADKFHLLNVLNNSVNPALS